MGCEFSRLSNLKLLCLFNREAIADPGAFARDAGELVQRPKPSSPVRMLMARCSRASTPFVPS